MAERMDQSNQASELPSGDLEPNDGVDVTLIQWMLEMTPAERLQTLQETMRSLEELRAGMPRD
jgi:hypothetical protein